MFQCGRNILMPPAGSPRLFSCPQMHPPFDQAAVSSFLEACPTIAIMGKTHRNVDSHKRSAQASREQMKEAFSWLQVRKSRIHAGSAQGRADLLVPPLALLGELQQLEQWSRGDRLLLTHNSIRL